MHHTPQQARIFAIAFRSSREAAAYMSKEFIGFALHAENPSQLPVLSMAADYQDRDHIVSHELAHVISFSLLDNQPRSVIVPDCLRIPIGSSRRREHHLCSVSLTVDAVSKREGLGRGLVAAMHAAIRDR